MCGILGLTISNEDLAKQAIDTFSYRGPDDTGTFSDEKLSLAFKRLAILDLDPRSNQPMRDAEDLVIVFNGEIYNYKDLRQELAAKYQFNTSSDTEVLLKAYREWGTDLIYKIKGMYAFCIYDKRKSKLYVFRDHAGIKPLYYYDDGDFFAFSSELKGVLSIVDSLEKDIELEKDNLNLYFALGYIPSPKTLYKKFAKLPPASFLEYDLQNRSLKIEEFKAQTLELQSYEDLSSLLDKKIREHLNADVPVGLFFSGGTDSSVIASFLKKNNVSLENFSIQMSHKNEDAQFFKAISSHLNIHSNVYDFGVKELEEVYFEVMERIDEPFVDASIFPTFYVSKKASEKVKVVLSGEGGDEYFYGYKRHKVLFALQNYTDYKMTFWDRLYFTLPSGVLKKKLFLKLFAWFKQPLSYYLLNVGVAKDLISWAKVKEEFKKAQLKPLDLDKKFYLENILLRKIDLATSYNSIEGRVPLLDVDVIAASDNFEAEKLKDGILKFVLKKILLFSLPRRLVFRGKSGFGINLKEKFKSSKILREDFFRAISFLEKINMLPSVFEAKRKEVYLKKYPALSFSLIVLFYCLKHCPQYAKQAE